MFVTIAQLHFEYYIRLVDILHIFMANKKTDYKTCSCTFFKRRRNNWRQFELNGDLRPNK